MGVPPCSKLICLLEGVINEGKEVYSKGMEL